MPELAFKQVDVFAVEPLAGNPLAVVLEGDGLDGAAMQRLARWTNLSETAFVLAPSAAGADYRVRIFTPGAELPFAGHPSIGTAHALLEAGRIRPGADGRLMQECAAGLLPLQVEGEGLRRVVRIRAPQARPLPIDPAAAALLTPALAGVSPGALAPALYQVGPRWWLVELADEQSVRAHTPRLAEIAELCRASGATGLALFAEAEPGAGWQRVLRAFCPADGIPEDPVTGSANAAIGAYLRDSGRLASGQRYVASQGRELGRDGRVEVWLAEDGVWIGGHSVTVVDGRCRLG